MLFKPNYSQIDIAGLSRASAIGHAMSDEKRARLNSYTATRDAILYGLELPVVINADAVAMLERELVCCVARLIHNEVTK